MASTIDCGDFAISISLKLGIHARPETIDDKTHDRMEELGAKFAQPKAELELAVAQLLAMEVLGMDMAQLNELVESRIERLKQIREDERSGRHAKAAKRAAR